MTDQTTGIRIARAEVRELTTHPNPNIAAIAIEALFGDEDALAFCVELVATANLETTCGRVA